MKKLILFASIAIASVMANAAATKWTWETEYGSYFYKQDNTTKFDGMVYLYAVGVTGDGLNGSIYSYNAATTPGEVFIDTPFSLDYFVADSKYDFYFSYTDGDKVFTSGKILDKVATETGATTLAFTSSHLAAGSWSASGNVPEPTSGLLLLLGMAGLALRRKRV